MIILDDRYGYNFDINILEKIKNNLTKKEIELIFMDNASIAEINEEFRGKNSATDVLSFPLEDMPNSPIGSVVINVDCAKEKALELGHKIDDEIVLLFIHGLLHLLGFDHECDDGEMREREKQLIEEFSLPKSLILRSE